MNPATDTLVAHVLPADKPGAQAADRRSRRKRRSSSLAAHGEPMVWLTGGALAIALSMIVALLSFVLWKGTGTFWPGPLELIRLSDGKVFLGELALQEKFQMDQSVRQALPPDLAAAARAAMPAESGWLGRRRLRTGNFELSGTHYEWVNDFAIVEQSRPAWAMTFERMEWGHFYGIPKAMLVGGKRVVDTTGMEGEPLEEAQQRAWVLYTEHHPAAVQRRKQIKEKEKFEVGRESHRSERARLAMRHAELDQGKDSAAYQDAKRHYEQIQAEVEKASVRIRGEIDRLAAENDQYQIVLATAQGQEKTLRLADIVRMYPANQLSLAGKIRIYLSRWREFLLDDPREANSEGGVWPAIVGTVTMTMTMAIAVVPFGVLAALYLREYAKAGPVTSAVRIAVNNLAGVPSIVFGVFGLGFFCYIVGSGVDDFFFPANVADGNPVFGKGALVWASLTLALLTLPVVIVASEEALAAVPNSMRDGSYACGASKWQTIRRIVLPHAMPGIMTGMILAMARGAGEVAPLMLVGAVKLAPEIPLDGAFPYIHPERSFMHLGFHIYDLGFQSQNSEAAKPMVFTTTLLLIVIIAMLNLLAVWLRGRLLGRFRTTHV